MAKNGCGDPGNMTFKLAISHRVINEINWCFEW